MNKILQWLAVGVAMLGVNVAHAALPAGIATAVTAAQTDGLALADLIWPALIILAGALLLFKLFKRFFNKI